MTAEELRNVVEAFQKRLDKLGEPPNELSLMVMIQTEIAAQLAELNATLKRKQDLNTATLSFVDAVIKEHKTQSE